MATVRRADLHFLIPRPCRGLSAPPRSALALKARSLLTGCDTPTPATRSTISTGARRSRWRTVQATLSDNLGHESMATTGRYTHARPSESSGKSLAVWGRQRCRGDTRRQRKYPHPMQITTPRLLLREFVESDAKAIQTYQSDPLYLRYNPLEQNTEQDTLEFVRRFISEQQEHPRTKFHLAVVLPSEGVVVGYGGLRMNDPTSPEGRIVYEIDSRYWGRGYATEVGREVLRFGFTECSLHRIAAGCFAENVASAHVLEKIGMKREGCLRERTYFKGRWWDSLLYAILAQEWQEMHTMPAMPT